MPITVQWEGEGEWERGNCLITLLVIKDNIYAGKISYFSLCIFI